MSYLRNPIAAQRLCLVSLGSLLAAALACHDPCSPASPTAADLLSLPVRSSIAQPVEELNADAQEALMAAESWPMDAVAAAWRFARSAPTRNLIVALDGAGELPTEYRAVVMLEGSSDDSVRGERLDLQMVGAEGARWQVRRAQLALLGWTRQHGLQRGEVLVKRARRLHSLP